jgi:hypothetical protein
MAKTLPPAIQPNINSLKEGKQYFGENLCRNATIIIIGKRKKIERNVNFHGLFFLT